MTVILASRSTITAVAGGITLLERAETPLTLLPKLTGSLRKMEQKKLIELAGTGKDKNSSNNKTHHAQSAPQEYDPFKDQQKVARRQNWPRFELPTQTEIEAIARLRGLSPNGVALAVEQGILCCADFRGARAWIVTDSRRVNAQARRLDAKPWAHEGLAKKAMSLPGSVGCWPIGLREAQDFPAIALLEGGPDLVAAFHFLWLSGPDDSIAPVAILGASNDIAKPALPHFKGKVVRVFPNNDSKGLAAARRWAAQLMAAGAVVDGFSFAGLTQADSSPVDDLNDFVRIDPDEWDAQRNIVEGAFDFLPATLTSNS